MIARLGVMRPAEATAMTPPATNSKRTKFGEFELRFRSRTATTVKNVMTMTVEARMIASCDHQYSDRLERPLNVA